jgi:TatD DNase family protein
MLVDTHSHINMIIKDTFDTPLTPQELNKASAIVQECEADGVSLLINVGTSVIESENCMALAKKHQPMYATIGIHPNDCTANWHNEVKTLNLYARQAPQHKIVGIGEIGLDRHYPDHNLPRQKDAFRAQIELALEYNLAIVVHTRNAADETLRLLHEYKTQISRGIIHCFSEDLDFAIEAINIGFSIGLGGTITYPKNDLLRQVARTIHLDKIVLETDAPFLPPQVMRGKKNHPRTIKIIAEYLGQLRAERFDTIEAITTKNALNIFGIDL